MMESFSRRMVALLTYDFCPWANRWFHWIKHPFAILCVAGGVALACAIFVKPLCIIAFAAILLVLLLGYAWPSLAIRGLASRLKFDRLRATEGDEIRALVRIVNRWPWPVWGVTIEGGLGAGEMVALARISGWSEITFEWRFSPGCRGEYPERSPRLMTGFPFGLRQAGRDVVVDGTLLIWPKVIALDTLLDAAETRPSDDQFSDQRIGDSGDMSGTRLFRDGDSLRRVHWAQTARQGKMIVCERQAVAQSAVRVVFDSDPRWHRGTGAAGTLEWSIRIAASVCAAYHRENAAVECCFGHEIIPLAPGAQGWKRFLDALSRWKACTLTRDSPDSATQGAVHAADCHHDHAPENCRRIHHRNCGVFQLTITTDLGLSHRTEHRHVHGDQRLVVLRTDAFEHPCGVCGNEHPAPGRAAILIDNVGDIPADFRRQWRHACHAG